MQLVSERKRHDTFENELRDFGVKRITLNNADFQPADVVGNDCSHDEGVRMSERVFDRNRTAITHGVANDF